MTATETYYLHKIAELQQHIAGLEAMLDHLLVS